MQPTDTHRVDSAPSPDDLGKARSHAARLARHQRVLTVSCFAVLGLVATRAIVAVVAPQLTPGGSPLILAVALAVCFSAALAGLWVAQRWTTRAAILRERLSWLERMQRSAAAAASSPYRAASEERADQSPRDVARDVSPASAWEITWACLITLVAGIVLGIAYADADAHSDQRRWMFLEYASDAATLDLLTPVHQAGVWRVEAHEHATGGRALVNYAGARAPAPALAISRSFRAEHLRVSTRCRALPPGAACGVAFRVHDPANYYFAQVDIAGQRIALGVAEDGVERIIAHAVADASRDAWHELVVEARGDRIEVSWNGSESISVRDLTHREGGAGLWAPSSDIAAFDELAIERLPGPKDRKSARAI